MAEFVYNRTQNHIDRLKQLRSKGYENLTASERAEYSGYAALGAYNASDLNRVESAVSELASLLGLTLTTKTDWAYYNQFTGFNETRYLGNVVTLRDVALSIDPTLVFPTLPKSMYYFTFERANAIEKVLSIIYERFRFTAPGSGTLDDPYVYPSIDALTKEWTNRFVPRGKEIYVEAPLGGKILSINSAPEGYAAILNDQDTVIAYSGDSWTFEESSENVVIGIWNINTEASEFVTLTEGNYNVKTDAVLGAMVLGEAVLGKGEEEFV